MIKGFTFLFLFSFSTIVSFAQINGKQVIGYYPNWQWYKRSSLVNPKSIDYQKYTIINYSFFKPEADGSISNTDSWADENLLLGEIDWNTDPYTYKPNTSIPSLAHAAGTKVMISVGGWTLSDNFPSIAASSQKRQTFATACVNLIKKYDLDGIDIDWEYPGYAAHGGTAADKQNFTLLMQAIRTAIDAYGTQIGKKFLLTAAVGANASTADDINWPEVIPILDYINLMTYDFFGTEVSISSHNSPLYPPSQGPTACISNSVEMFINTYNVPASKLNAGIAFYGKAVTNCSGIYSSHSGIYDKVSFPEDEGWPMYYNIVASMNNYNEYWDEDAQSPYLLGKSTNNFVTFDNIRSIGEKAKYVVDQNLAGVIIWEITGDYLTDNGGNIYTPLADTIYNTFMNYNSGNISQTIELGVGWNLISVNVLPSYQDCTENGDAKHCISTLFNGLDVRTIKTMSTFWDKNQPDYLNTLQTITPGEGYLVYMNAAGTMTVTGIPFSILNFQFSISNAWNLIGCPYQSPTPCTNEFNASNCQIIKNFEGFWEPNGTMNSIQNMEPGKGYFIK